MKKNTFEEKIKESIEPLDLQNIIDTSNENPKCVLLRKLFESIIREKLKEQDFKLLDMDFIDGSIVFLFCEDDLGNSVKYELDLDNLDISEEVNIINSMTLIN